VGGGRLLIVISVVKLEPFITSKYLTFGNDISVSLCVCVCVCMCLNFCLCPFCCELADGLLSISQLTCHLINSMLLLENYNFFFSVDRYVYFNNRLETLLDLCCPDLFVVYW
jgi:hypothetical protein